MIPPVLEQIRESGISISPVKRNCLARGGPFKLNLGGIGDAGKSAILPGFLTVDLQDNPLTDIQSDISDLSMLKDGDVDEIYASNCLEHFPHTHTVSVLKEWHRVLESGGILWISVPDMDANFRIYQLGGMTTWLANIMWGDQTHPHAYHYINFNFASLAKACYDAGFKEIERLVMMPFKLRDASANLDNIERKPVSLNVKCRK